jgi:hypothetical protein
MLPKPTLVIGWDPVAGSATMVTVIVAEVPVGNEVGVLIVSTRLHVVVPAGVVPRLTATVSSMPVAAGFVPGDCVE